MELFQLDALGEFITGIVLFIYASVRLHIRFNVLNILLLIVAVLFGTLIFTSIKIACAAIAFWVKRSGSILQVFYMSSDFARYPITIYNKTIKYIISYVVPFAFTSYYPASYFLRGNDPVYCIGGVVIISMVMMVVSVLIWNRGIRAYESAGS